MLRSLQIENLALVDHLDIEFQAGLNLITGETGAGKSILIDALGFVLGQRASVSLIREGSPSCQVQAVFELMDHNLTRWNQLLEQRGLPVSDGELWLKRELNDKGRSRAWVNGSAAPLAVLTELGNRLVDFHGQHENQSLMRPATHLRLLDRYAVLTSEVQNCRQLYKRWTVARDQREAAWVSEEERLRRLDMLRYQVQELQEAALKKGEWEELKETRLLSASAEKRALLTQQLDASLNGTNEEGNGAREKLENAVSAWRELARLDPSLAEQLERLEAAASEVQDIAVTLSDYQDKLDYDPAQLDRDEARLSKLESLSRKYGGDEDGMILFLENAEAELTFLENHENEKMRLDEAQALAREVWVEAAGGLSKARGKASKKLAKAIGQGLAELGMDKAVFEVGVKSPGTTEGIDQAAGPEGFDEVAFLLSANPGQPPKELAKAASGGEISRVMLAVKSVLADVDPVDTLVFDEIDQGVSGRVADAVGEKLSQLSTRRQIFVITHLPQVASRPALHFKVSKASEAGNTSTSVVSLNQEERVQELASLIDGKNLTASGLEHARHLLAGAQAHD